MRKRLTSFGIISLAGLVCFNQLHAGESTIPKTKTLSNINPYLKKAEYLVARGMKQAKNNQKNLNKIKGEAFWLTWGYTAQESKHHEKQEIGDQALKLTEYWTAELEKKPKSYWELIPILQTVDFWRTSSKVDNDKIKQWLKRIRPSVTACYKSQIKSGWITVAPNTLHQAAAGLELAAQLYRTVNPEDKDTTKWSAKAKECMDAAAKHQLPGGAFSYIRTSGPDPCYYNFDSTFMGIYYLLTNDKETRESLAKMSGWSRSATRCGWLTAFASPWWKHFWGTGGPYFGPEIIAGISHNPLTARVMQLRRQQTQPYYFMYYAMGFYDPAIKPEMLAKRAEYDGNANGAAFRDGDCDIVMPFTSWNESTAGISISDTLKVSSYVTSICLTPVTASGCNYQKSYSIVHRDKTTKRSMICGNKWIAQAVVFAPVPGAYGSLPQKASPWQRIDLWYADADGGLAGQLWLTCKTENTCDRVAVWTRTSKNFKINGDRLASPDLMVTLSGKLGEFKLVDKRKNIFESLVDETGKRQYKAGESFTIGATVNKTGKFVLAVGPATVKNNIYSVTIMKSGKPAALLIFNNSSKEAAFTPAEGFTCMQTGSKDGKSLKKSLSGKILLASHQLVVLK